MQFLKKISPKTVCGDVKKIAKAMQNGQTKELMTVYGFAQEMEMVESDKGTSVRFKGDFEAVHNNEKYRSGQMFLPGVAEAILYNWLQNSEGAQVQFALSLSIRADEDMIVGYEYAAQPLIEDTDADPMDQIRKALPGGKST
jgi:hypothetical protein